MREHVATAAAIGVILGVLAPEIDFGPPEAEAARIAPPCVVLECALPNPQRVQAKTACSIPNCAETENGLNAAPINQR